MRIALIGLGGVAERIHLPACRRVETIEVACACDPDPARRAIGEHLGVPVVYHDADEMLRRESPDVVIVGTPPRLHFEHALAALEGGAHVFCEKPFVARLEEADRLIEEADRRGLHLRVNNQYRYMEIYRDTRERIERGELGRPYFLQCWQQMFHPPDRESNWRAELERYTLFEFGTHALDLICYLLDALPSSIHAHVPEVPHGHGSDVLVQASLRFPDDALATLALNRVSHAPERYLEMRLDCEDASVRLSYGGLARLSVDWRRALGRPALRFGLCKGGEARIERGGRSRTSAREFRDPLAPATAVHLRKFVDEIVAERISTAAARHARAILEIVFAGYESAETGRTVEFQADGLDDD